MAYQQLPAVKYTKFERKRDSGNCEHMWLKFKHYVQNVSRIYESFLFINGDMRK
jgi:hypothetical protein